MDTKPAVESLGAGHETRDAKIQNLVRFGVGLFVLVGIVLLAMGGLFHYFAAHQKLGPPASPFEEVRTLPPQPRLQVTPAQDLKRFRAAEDAKLKSYGWVDQNVGIVRIPIDRAMDLLVQRGLPVRSNGQDRDRKGRSSAPPQGKQN